MLATPTEPGEALPWRLGFRNASGMYLTVEPFGNRININSKVLKTKQLFLLEKRCDSDQYSIKCHTNRYLSCKPNGSIQAVSDSVGKEELFEIETQPDGRWCIISCYGYYLGGEGDHVDAYCRTAEESRKFHVHLGVHPQLNIWNINRKAFLHLKNDYVACDEVIPWGDDAVITLRYVETENKYCLELANGKFLRADGRLDDVPTPECLFVMEMYSGTVAFKAASNNRYLTCISGEGVARATKTGPPSPSELFAFEDSQPQIKLTSWQGKKVSVLGQEVLANQTETRDTEQFQIEINAKGTWAIRTCKNMFLYVDDEGSIQANATSKAEINCEFQIQWHNDKLAIKASNGKFISVKKNSALCANSDEISDTTKFVFELTNRPRLVLRSEVGFVNTIQASGNIMANKAQIEVLSMHVQKGNCYIKGSNGKYIAPHPDGVKIGAISDLPSPLFFEFISLSKCAIRCIVNGEIRYLKVNSSGTVSCDATEVDNFCLFEY